ncbi:lamin tail domain-containing protein 1 [Enhydra lutris kenyoni]|uniref:Lamin tail domain-containing protein 1 n=1 Tax=Enhydra lutris kenyoni TaxID=391180 RepID=A0A2Y9KWI0_ENHLU|nr:lamin tail domain-containing protein 1 [Enhydra lutris kenyoni]
MVVSSTINSPLMMATVFSSPVSLILALLQVIFNTEAKVAFLKQKSDPVTPQFKYCDLFPQERKENFLLAKMKGMQASQKTSVALQSELHEQEDKMKNQTQRKDTQDSLLMTQRSLAHFFSTANSDTTLSFPWSLSYEMPLDYTLSSPHFSGLTVSTIGQKTPKTTGVGLSRSENSLGINSSIMTKRQALPYLAPEIPVTGEGEDYFLSLFGDSKKLLSHSSPAEKAWKHFSMILEEVGQSRSSMVWAAVSEAKHQPPSDFLWREQNKFRTSPNCTTILCKPNGEAVAWYTPIHWKQAWEKLETDIEFDRRSVVSPTSQRHMFSWPAAITTTKEKQDKCNKDNSKCQMEQVKVFLKREIENRPSPFPNSSPWCHSPSAPAHPYSPLIETCSTCVAGNGLDRQPRPQSSRPDPAQITSSHPASGYYFFVIKYWQCNLIILLHFQRNRKG